MAWRGREMRETASGCEADVLNGLSRMAEKVRSFNLGVVMETGSTSS